MTFNSILKLNLHQEWQVPCPKKNISELIKSVPSVEAYQAVS